LHLPAAVAAPLSDGKAAALQDKQALAIDVDFDSPLRGRLTLPSNRQAARFPARHRVLISIATAFALRYHLATSSDQLSASGLTVAQTLLFPQKRSPLTGLGYFSESYRRDFPLHL